MSEILKTEANPISHLDKSVPIKSENQSPTNPLLKAHESLSLLDSDFQNTLSALQATQSQTTLQISSLNAPIDDLISLFESFKSPSNSGLGIENTLHILTTLMARYDNTLAILYKTRQIARTIESSDTISINSTNEWRYKMANVVREVRSVLTTQNESIIAKDEKIDSLTKQLAKVEEEKLRNEKLVLNLVAKLNAAEESMKIYNVEKKELLQKFNSIKTRIAGISKWREHVQGLGVAKELRSKTASEGSSRERALEYSKRIDARVKSAGATTSKSPESRMQSRNPSSLPLNGDKRLKNRVKEVRIEDRPRNFIGKETDDDKLMLGSLLGALNFHSHHHDGQRSHKLYPAESILLSKLSDVDSQIDLYLRDFHH